MTDDLSQDALTALVDAGHMPNLQQYLIDGGVTFENSFVTNSVCCPSRATFLTGQYSHNHGIFSNHSPNPLIPGIGWPGWLSTLDTPGRNESTLPVWLAAAGYRTGFIGKYLNGYGNVAPEGVAVAETWVPPGWDDWQGLIDPTTYRVYDYTINDNGTLMVHGSAEADYQTDVLADRAVDFVTESLAAGETFFLTVSPLAPHVEVVDIANALDANDPREGFAAEIRPAPRHAVLADGDPVNGEVPGPLMKPSFGEEDMSDKPSCPVAPPPPGLYLSFEPYCIGDRLPLRADPDVPRLENQWKTMLAATIAVDDLLGDIVAALQTGGVLDQTVIVFTSDNGWLYGEHRTLGKVLAYEESIRVPLLIRSPGQAQGVTASQVVLNNDLAPTLAALGGATIPYDPDGASLVPILQDPSFGAWHRRTFLVEYWFIPSLHKFSDPTFFAMRSVLPGRDFLYITTHFDQDNLLSIQHRELYLNEFDPYQESSFDTPAGLAEAFDGILGYFRTCQGSFCRMLEGL